MSTLEKSLLLLLVLFIPSQLGYHFWPSWSLVNGTRIDYLSPTLFFNDVLIFLLLVISKNLKTPPVWLMTIAFINILFAISPVSTFFQWIRVFEYSLLLVCLINNRVIVHKILLYSLPISLLVVSTLAWLQFITQSSVGGIWYFFGERTFTLLTPGIAKIQLGNQGLFLRAYSTFSHPNSLAGFLLVGITLLKHLISSSNISFWRKWFHGIPLLAISLSYLTIFVTFSRTIIFLTILTFIAEKTVSGGRVQYKSFLLILSGLFVLSLALLNLGGSRSVLDRLQLQHKAISLINARPLLGVGLGGFVSSQKQVINSPTLTLTYQPVHNIYLLILAELGIPIFIIVIYRIINTLIHYPPSFYLGQCFMLILASGYMDHYWLTLHQNQLLFVVLVGLYLSSIKTPYELTK